MRELNAAEGRDVIKDKYSRLSYKAEVYYIDNWSHPSERDQGVQHAALRVNCRVQYSEKDFKCSHIPVTCTRLSSFSARVDNLADTGRERFTLPLIFVTSKAEPR